MGRFEQHGPSRLPGVRLRRRSVGRLQPRRDQDEALARGLGPGVGAPGVEVGSVVGLDHLDGPVAGETCEVGDVRDEPHPSVGERLLGDRVAARSPERVGGQLGVLGTDGHAHDGHAADRSGRERDDRGSAPTMTDVTIYERPFGRYLEDFQPGDVYRHWPGKTITEADDHLFCMITMNHHPLHTNVWFAENETVHGKNVVVGNLVYSLVLGMSVPDVSGAAIANLEIESLKHAKPTFHGDTIYAETKVLATKETSKGDRGIVTVETKGINQRGEEVCFFRRKVMVWKRDAAPPRQRPYGEEIWDDPEG